MGSSATPDAVASMPARTFVLADHLDVEVSTCAATVWHLPADPGAVHVLLARDPEDTTTVAISLDLLTGGMYGRVDRGRTTVWPCGDDDVVCVGMRGLHHAVMELPRTALATFLAEIPTTRPRDRGDDRAVLRGS
jgi:Streptomyces sporulation and cell division protein, SsgA